MSTIITGRSDLVIKTLVIVLFGVSWLCNHS